MQEEFDQLARRGYPTFTPDAREELALCTFIQGLTPEHLKEHLRITAPKTFSAALEEAERVEPVLMAKCSQRPQVCQADIGDESASTEEDVCQARPSPAQSNWQCPLSRGRTRRSNEPCYHCGEVGHIARDCPAPAP
ncbi:hypothetical protein LDENG_00158010 [Lucifuga dentata]|nr:hypothetical protein LDENG_00158010 [Lucifuga dentata]